MKKRKRTRLHWITNLIAACDNYSLKKKFVAIYVMCVFLPVGITDTLVLGLVYNSEVTQRQHNAERIADAAEYLFTNCVDDAVQITKDVYTNRNIYDFLSRDYKDAVEYYDQYNKMKQNYFLHTSFTNTINSMAFYTENDSIISGGEYAKLSDVSDTQWYEYFSRSGRDMVVTYYYDESTKYIQNYSFSRIVSVIRKLNYYEKSACEKSACEKLVKIDLDYNQVSRDLRNANYEGKVYLCDGDVILFSNVSTGSASLEYQTIDPKIRKKADYVTAVSVYSQNLQIIVVSNQNKFIYVLKDKLWIFVLLILFNLVIPVTAIFSVEQSMTRRIQLLGEYLDRVKEEKFEVIKIPEAGDELGRVITNYNLMVVKMKELIEVVYKDKMERQELKLARRQAELLALRIQINPHFMFNALESIRMRSLLKKEDATAQVIGNLAVLMRKCTDWSLDQVTIQEELEFVKAYLKIQKYRFGDEFTYSIQTEEECKELLIPKLTLVTFVENACVHGIEGTSRKGIIMVTVFLMDGDLNIVIEDNGVGMMKEQREQIKELIDHAQIKEIEHSKSVGMLNACIRLKQTYHGKIKILLESEKDEGTVITLVVSRNELIYQEARGEK